VFQCRHQREKVAIVPNESDFVCGNPDVIARVPTGEDASRSNLSGKTGNYREWPGTIGLGRDYLRA
jgi:hypothetical protein